MRGNVITPPKYLKIAPSWRPARPVASADRDMDMTYIAAARRRWKACDRRWANGRPVAMGGKPLHRLDNRALSSRSSSKTKTFWETPGDQPSMSALRALASSLGLSITTVSRALDGYRDVSPSTRERVRLAADAANYRPHAAARRLRLGASETVSIVLPGDPGHFDEPLYMELLAALGARLDAAGLDLMVLAARSPVEELALYRRLVEGRRTDGIVLARTRVDDPRIRALAESGIPCVVMGRTEAALPYAHVDGDGAAAFAEATRRLVALGHREIAYVGAPAEFMFSKLRRDGWAAAMTAAGLAPAICAATAATEQGGL